MALPSAESVGLGADGRLVVGQDHAAVLAAVLAASRGGTAAARRCGASTRTSDCSGLPRSGSNSLSARRSARRSARGHLLHLVPLAAEQRDRAGGVRERRAAPAPASCASRRRRRAAAARRRRARPCARRGRCRRRACWAGRARCSCRNTAGQDGGSSRLAPEQDSAGCGEVVVLGELVHAGADVDGLGGCSPATGLGRRRGMRTSRPRPRSRRGSARATQAAASARRSRPGMAAAPSCSWPPTPPSGRAPRAVRRACPASGSSRRRSSSPARRSSSSVVVLAAGLRVVDGAEVAGELHELHQRAGAHGLGRGVHAAAEVVDRSARRGRPARCRARRPTRTAPR